MALDKIDDFSINLSKPSGPDRNRVTSVRSILCASLNIPESTERLLLMLSILRGILTHVLPSHDDSSDLIDHISENIRKSREEHEELRAIAERLLEQAKAHLEKVQHNVNPKRSINNRMKREITVHTKASLFFTDPLASCVNELGRLTFSKEI